MAAAAGLLLGVNCTREADPSLGVELVPQNQKLEMRHKSFFADKLEKYDPQNKKYVVDEGRNFFKTSIFRTDSILSSNLQTGYIGVQNNDVFGKREAAFASEFVFMSSIGDEGFGYLPIFDSMQLLLSVSDFGGDTTRVNTFEVYEVLTSLSENMQEVNDDETTAYIGHDMEPLYDPSKRLFTFRFPDQQNGIYTTSTAVTMTPESLSADSPTWDFIRRLMLVESDDPKWNGYAENTEIYKSDEAFTEKFRGLYIKPVDDLGGGNDGAMYALDLSASGFYLAGRNRNPDEPRLVKDTLYVPYYFYYENASAGNTSINSVKYDFSNSDVLASAMMTDDPEKSREQNREAHTQSALGYVEGMGGPVMEICFDNDFLGELRNINDAGGNDENDFRYASVNQARLHIYLDKVGDYEWWNLDASVMTPLLDDSMPRLGLYTNYASLTPVPDYNFLYEQQYNTSLPYGGSLNRSLCCYVMDISSYMQRLKNYVDELNPDNTPGFDYAQVFDDMKESGNYISRIIYLAPEATALYNFKHSTVQGMFGQDTPASMKIDITYTMIR